MLELFWANPLTPPPPHPYPAEAVPLWHVPLVSWRPLQPLDRYSFWPFLLSPPISTNNKAKLGSLDPLNDIIKLLFLSLPFSDLFPSPVCCQEPLPCSSCPKVPHQQNPVNLGFLPTFRSRCRSTQYFNLRTSSIF